MTTYTDEILERACAQIREATKSFIGVPYNKETGYKIALAANDVLDRLGITNIRCKSPNPDVLLFEKTISIK